MELVVLDEKLKKMFFNLCSCLKAYFIHISKHFCIWGQIRQILQLISVNPHTVRKIFVNPASLVWANNGRDYTAKWIPLKYCIVLDSSRVRFCGACDSVESDSAVRATLRNLTLRCVRLCGIWLCGACDSAESDSAVRATLWNLTLRCEQCHQWAHLQG
jgi:hypothetical protein